jgi:hypothetical protein
VLAYPKRGERVESSTLVFAGGGGIAPGDLPTVSIAVYPGTDTSGAAVATYTAGLDSRGAFRLAESLPDGTYTAMAVQADLSGNKTLSSAAFTVYTAAAPPIS